MEMDPPEHTRYRRLVSKPFSRREVYAYEAAIRGLARLVIDEVAASGATTFDFVEAIAKQLPMRMLGGLLGVPDEDGPWLVEQGDALLGNTDPDFTSHPVDLVDTEEFRLLPFRSPAGIDLFRYAEEQARTRRAHPTDDVISDLLAPMVDGEPPDRPGVRQLLHPARGRGQRHDPLHDDAGDAGAHGASRAARRAAPRARRHAMPRSRRSCAGGR